MTRPNDYAQMRRNAHHGSNLSTEHVGINCENEAEAKKLVSLCAISSTWKPATKTIPIPLISTAFEVMKHNQIGTHGHIALQTDDVEAAMKDLASKGITFKENTIRRNEEGKITFIYLDGDIAGFSFHLTV